MLKKLLLPLLFVAFLAVSATAQTGSITGTVTNEKGEPVPTANVLLVELGRGAATNLQGVYTIKNVKPGTYTLRATFVGYKDFSTQVTIEAGQTLTKDITLKRGSVGLAELVVTGFGTQSKIEYTGSAASVDVSEQIENIPVANVGAALQGSVTGLNITGGSGTPGSAIEFNIRGVSSINAGGDPLIVLDGVPVSGDSPQWGISTDQGILASIPPQSIKSVTVLKGPVATAQYGAEGANGVVVITTKRGTAGEARFSVSYQRGTVSRAVPFPDMVNAFQYAELYREGTINSELLDGDDDPVKDPKEIPVPGWDGQTNTNWAELMSNDNASTQRFTITASGGNEAANYYGSFSYQNQESIVISSGYERFAGTFNFSYDFNENVSISNNFIGSYSTLRGIREGSAYFANPTAAPLFIAPIYPAYDKDGSINISLTGNYNPLWIAEKDISRTRNYRLINSTKLNVDLLDNLTLHSEVGIDYSVLGEKTYANPKHGWASGSLNGYARSASNTVFLGTWQTGLSYLWSINENHTIDTRVVNTIKIYNSQQLVATANGFPVMGLTNVASASTPLFTRYFVEDGSLLSFLAKAHYSYKDKIFLDATIRREGNSRFAEGYRWGTFYGVGAGWLISSEDFLSSADWLDLLKIRASYGVAGNNAIGRNEYQSFLAFAEAYASRGAVYPDQLGNPILTWEKKRSMEAGLSFGLFNRIDGDITVFRSKTYDLLYQVPLSRTTGFNSQLSNVGELVGKGLEVALNIDVIRTEDFLMNISGNFTYVSNEVTKLPTDATGTELTVLDRMRYVAEDHPVHEWYMKTYAGVNKHNGRPLWELNREPTDKEINSGKVFKLDRFGNTWLTSYRSLAEQEYQGATPIPTHYGSVGITLNYKGFYAGASLFGEFGAKIYDGFAEYYHSDGEYPYPTMASELDRWQKPGQITDTPRRIAGGNRNSNGNSTRFLYGASFLRLQTLRLGYNVPATLLNDLGIGVRGLNIYLTARNLWTHKFDDDLVWGPMADDTGFLDVSNQAQKAFTLGINVQF